MSKENEKLDHHGDDDSIGGIYPNETMRLLHERSSCRSFHDRKIPPDVMQLVLEAGIHAPTGGNLQPYSIIKIEDQKVKDRLAKLCGEQVYISTAPTDLLFCIDFHRLRRWAEIEVAPFNATSSFRHFWLSFQDTIITAQNICTAADAMGLGSVYIGTVTECFPEIREMCQLPDGVFPVVLLCLGYPKEQPLPKRKLGVSTVVHDERYHDLSDTALKEVFDIKYPSRKLEVKDDRLDKIAEVCRAVHGPDFAEKCIEKIKRQGYLNVVHNYFALHYVADSMAHGNETFLKIMEDFGFTWFKEYHPLEKRSENT